MKDIYLELYRKMLTIRFFEEAINMVYKQGLMPGLAHLYIGEEATAVGICSVLDQQDYVVSTHRGHGHLIAKGGDPRLMMAEVLGKKTGYCKGKGGSMHIAEPALRIIGANGIVAAGIPIAVGAALGCKVAGTDGVVVSFFGDGATNQGAFHEALNLASLWQLPVIFVCENNLYGISVSQQRHQKIPHISKRAEAYEMPGISVDGNDVLAVRETALAAISRARQGTGPTLIECKTYRWGGHHIGDPGTSYRPPDEISEWKDKCPIKRFGTKLLHDNIITPAEDEQIRREIQTIIDEAVEFAKESPYPEPEEALQDLFQTG